MSCGQNYLAEAFTWFWQYQIPSITSVGLKKKHVNSSFSDLRHPVLRRIAWISRRFKVSPMMTIEKVQHVDGIHCAA